MPDLPRVTDIIKFAGLMPPYKGNRNYLERGSAVDVGCQLLFQGHKLEDLEVDPQIVGYLRSLKLWIRHTGFKAERIQPEYISKLGYVGHPDAHDVDLLVDTKTGSPARWHRIQTAFYQTAANENDDVWIKRRASLYLHESGAIAKFDPHEDRSDWGVALSALKLYQGEKELEVYRENIRKWKEAA